MIAKSLVRFLLFLMLPLSSATWAATASPDAMVQDVTNQVLAILRQDKGIHSGNRQRAESVIQNTVAPHFDFNRMTSLAVGRAWRQADAGQQKALTDAFRTLLVHTYANALVAYRDQTVSFTPSRRGSTGDEVTVHSQVDQPGAKPIAIDYSLAKAQGEWRVFDVAIAGVSLVTNYRTSFAGEVSRGGIDGLIKSLQEKNRQFQAASPGAA
ncbi:MAG TPA: ABC transporter substrate-binding protein [Rhodocyclaceae bacterium]|nr:ABC transporter substrate-binding protein [Rhodocyclaceae bacterium]